ncbi:uncharacterized protein YndB with AHSA1/START domain [Stella humosa]|uniref:Uncharacterized protein YndB with AHSA1/START domain n=1 Tax=Stella humosa TaxID=94 RepID=A0A3N1KZP1_9PROT|nr:SRPBCC domain-containing protein [Stella humosa]ROP84647.1 uncharacterized protein YndB with AHSA1/START domain [Stella humosa]BBK34167.1 hypothetical protein STHU_48010 [Stella humosa]
MSGAAIMVAVTVAAPPERAFALFTDEVDVWWQRGPAYRFRRGNDGTMRFDPGPGGRLVEAYPDGTLFEVGHIRDWQPGRRLAFSWRNPHHSGDEETEVEIEFKAVPGGTRVVVRHSGWDRLNPGHPARHALADVPLMRMMGDWWRGQLAAMAGRLPG